MKTTALALSLALVAAPASVSAQIASTVGPTVAPLGSPITITISNDTEHVVYSGVCPYVVRNGAEAAPVYSPVCIAVAVAIQPGDTLTAIWDQTDSAGQPVSAGQYYVEVTLPGGEHHVTPVLIASVDAALSILGTAKLGTTRGLMLSAPNYPNVPYRLAASFDGQGPIGIATCAGPIPLAADALFALSLKPSGGLFAASSGLLASKGSSADSQITLPDEASLAGLKIRLSFVVINPFASACPLAAISEPLLLTLFLGAR